MAVPVKIAIGILGGGTVAVGGYEVVAANTNLPGIFSKKTILTDKEKVDAWIKETEGFKGDKPKCSLQIFVDGVARTSILENDDLSGLVEFLNKGTVADACASDTESGTKEIIVQKISNEWLFYPTVEQKIQVWIGGQKDGCAVKVKRKESSSTEEDWTTVKEPESLEGIWAALEEIKTQDCSSSQKVVLKEGDNDTWTKEDQT